MRMSYFVNIDYSTMPRGELISRIETAISESEKKEGEMRSLLGVAGKNKNRAANGFADIAENCLPLFQLVSDFKKDYLPKIQQNDISQQGMGEAEKIAKRARQLRGDFETVVKNKKWDQATSKSNDTELQLHAILRDILGTLENFYDMNQRLKDFQNENNKPKNEKIILHLDRTGDLWRDPKNAYCYPMSAQKEPLKILRSFIDNPNSDYADDTYATANNLGKDPQHLRTEIGKFNRTAIKRLELEEKIIESKQNSGYRLNPNIKILLDE